MVSKEIIVFYESNSLSIVLSFSVVKAGCIQSAGRTIKQSCAVTSVASGLG